MKNLITLIIVLIPLLANPQGFWKSLNSPTDKSLTQLDFIDSLRGWVAGDSSFIFRTTDGGSSWEQQYQNDKYDIKDIFFLDENFGWAVGTPIDFAVDIYALLLNTTDGGINWDAELYGEENVFFNSVFYFDSSYGWMGGIRGNIVYTTNAGERWHKASIDSGLLSDADIYKIKFYSDSLGIASGGAFDIAGQVWISKNGGMNWHVQPDNPPDIVVDFNMFDTTHIVSITKEIETYGSGIFRTTNGGQSWTYTNFGFAGPATTLAFRTPNEAWVSQMIETLFDTIDVYFFFKSVDSAYTWDSVHTPDNSWIYELQFTDTSTGYGVGQWGKIIRYKYDTISVAADDPPLVYNYRLYQNYPNPFNPDTKIKFELAVPGFTKITVLNILGESVKTLLAEEKYPGIYEIDFSAAGLPSGIYFCELRVNNFFETKKMILLR